MEKRRLTATKSRIASITKGNFVKQEGFTPNYVLAGNGLRLSRVRVLATVVDKFLSEGGKFAAVTLDDGTDTIRAKVFNAVSMYENINVGDIVDMVARVKEYNGEVYLAPEIITKAEPNMEILRDLELKEQEKSVRKIRDLVVQYKRQISDMAELNKIMKERYGIDEETVESMLSVQDSAPAEEEKSVKERVLEMIAKMDTGQGCDYSELLEASKLSEETMDSVINELLEEGTCFEPKPGKIKKL